MVHFLLVVLLSFTLVINDVKGQVTCDETAAQEECMARGCDCWLTSEVVLYKKWLEACINNLCSYTETCQDYGCTFEECIEGNCDLGIDYTEVCEDYCKVDNCGILEKESDLIEVYNSETKLVPNDFLPLLSEVNSYVIIEFDFNIISYDSTKEWGRHGGFFFGSGTSRGDVPKNLVTSIDWIDRNTEYGFRFWGLTNNPSLIITTQSGNGFTFAYSTINRNPNGHWKIKITKADLRGEFLFNDMYVWGPFLVNYPTNGQANLGFWAHISNRIQMSNIKVTYDSL